MKQNILVLATLALSLHLQAQTLSTPKQIKVKGAYSNPVVSPDENYALLTEEHLKGVFLLNLKNNTIKQISDKDGSGYSYSWNATGNEFYFREKDEKDYFSNAKVVSYNIATKKLTQLSDIYPNYLPSYKGQSSDIVVYTNLTTLKIEAKNLKTSKSWIITNEDGQYYNALLSHDGKKVAVHRGADIYVYDIEGKTKGLKIGTGIATGWSEDDRYLIGFLDESRDGHSVSNSDLYLFDATAEKPVKLTSTEDKIEMFPCFYGTNKVMFSDDKTGKIYTSELKL